MEIKKLPTLFKKATTGKITQWTIEIEGNCYRTYAGYVNGVITKSEDTKCFGKNSGKANATSDEDQAFKEAEAIWTKKKDTGHFESINDVDKELYFKPMLAEKYEDRKDNISFPCAVQPKLDGIRCIVKSDGMWTRNGKQIVAAPHIYESLKPLFMQDPSLVFDGELYNHIFKHDFNKITSLVKKTKPTAEDLKESSELIEYHIYDFPSQSSSFLTRYEELCFYINHDTKCKIVSTKIANDIESIDNLFEAFLADGYEGAMIRNINSNYENKRTRNLLKRKEFSDSEYTIETIESGNGKLANVAAFMSFTSESGYRFTAAINGTHEYLKEIWDSKDLHIGKQATVKYFNLTPDGIPRFPKVIAIRDFE
jgi:DNA ligase-1